MFAQVLSIINFIWANRVPDSLQVYLFLIFTNSLVVINYVSSSCSFFISKKYSLPKNTFCCYFVHIFQIHRGTIPQERPQLPCRSPGMITHLGITYPETPNLKVFFYLWYDNMGFNMLFTYMCVSIMLS